MGSRHPRPPGELEVSLVTGPIERITPNGVVTADGTTRPADVLIYGTGFKAGESLVPMTVSGRGGKLLEGSWRDGARAYQSITVSGFPNFSLRYGPNTNLGGNSIIYMLEGRSGTSWTRCGRWTPRTSPGWTCGKRPRTPSSPGRRRPAGRAVWESGWHSWYTTASGRNINNWPGLRFMYRYRVRRFDRPAYHGQPA